MSLTYCRIHQRVPCQPHWNGTPPCKVYVCVCVQSLHASNSYSILFQAGSRQFYRVFILSVDGSRDSLRWSYLYKRFRQKRFAKFTTSWNRDVTTWFPFSWCFDTRFKYHQLSSFWVLLSAPIYRVIHLEWQKVLSYLSKRYCLTAVEFFSLKY